MKCNVAEFIGSIQDNGAETLVKDYALMLDGQRFNVVIIVLRRSPDSANDAVLVKNGVRIITIFKSDFILFKVIQRLNYWWYVPLRLRRILKDEHIDVLHVHMALLRYVAGIRKHLNGIKLFYTCHSDPKLYFCGKRKREGKAAGDLIHSNGLQIIALQDTMRNEINALFGVDNTVVIRNGVDFHRFTDLTETKQQIRRSIGIPDDAFVIGHVGRFVPSKNHEFLVEVFGQFVKRMIIRFYCWSGRGRLCLRSQRGSGLMGLKTVSLSCRIGQISRA